jgi:acetyl-CoA acetyltransferase
VPESTASLAVTLQRALGIDPRVVNRWGGAIALGELSGASDLRALVTLVHQLERDELTSGLVVGGGLGVGAAARLTRR